MTLLCREGNTAEKGTVLDMENPLVSAIITTHNRKELLMRAIESVRNQTYPNIEIIVADDGSTDGTREAVEEAAQHGPLIYLHNTDAPGGNRARNIGIRQAEGEYLAFLDDDDEWFPSKTEKQVRYYQEHPELALVGCARTDEYDYRVRIRRDPRAIPEGDLSRAVFCTFLFSTSCMMIRRDQLLKAGLFDESLQFWQDYELQIRLCQIGAVGVVRENLTLYRILSADRERKTNRFDGWMQAVREIQSRHRALIQALPEDMQRRMELNILEDGIYRAAVCGRSSEQQRFLERRNFLIRRLEEAGARAEGMQEQQS